MAKVNVYEMVTNRIIEKMQNGIIPWERGWIGGSHGELAISYNTRKPYSLLNQMMLDNVGEYLTFKQCKDLGGKVKKGAKSEMVVFFKPMIIKNEETGEEKSIPFLQYYNVFHISQCEGIESKLETVEYTKLSDDEKIAKAEKLIKAYEQVQKIEIECNEKNTPCYIPALDKIEMPAFSQFKNANRFYKTMFHEMTHSTGHISRLDRFSKQKSVAFGSKDYSKEELVAEMGSAFLLNMLGLENVETEENAVAYLQSWIQKLQNDSKFIVSASSQAEKACKLIMESMDKVKDTVVEVTEKVTKTENKAKKVEGNGEMKLEKGIEKINKMLEMKSDKMYDALLDMREELIEEMRIATENEKGTPKKDITIIKNMMKKRKDERFNKAQKYNDKFAFLDGYRLFITDNDMGYEVAENSLNINKIMDIQTDKKIKFDEKDIRNFIKENKGIKEFKPYIVKVEDFYMGFNAEYLIDAIDWVGCTEFEMSNCKAPIYANREEKEILVLPVYVKTVEEENVRPCEIINQ